MSDITGSEILDIANSSYRAGSKRYRGFEWLTAVGQAKAQIEKKRGGRRDRREEAEHTVHVLFDHARKQEASRIDAIAKEAQQSQAPGHGSSTITEMDQFASEVVHLLNGPLSGGFGVFDPSMIISLIMGIINAIKACRTPTPPPVPTPV